MSAIDRGWPEAGDGTCCFGARHGPRHPAHPGRLRQMGLAHLGDPDAVPLPQTHLSALDKVVWP